MPLITVVTICYNDAPGLAATLKSAKSQIAATADFEVVVVDGGSQDGSQLVAGRAGLNNLRLISEPDEGVYDAMNKGFALGLGEYYIFLNSGDRFAHPGALGEVLLALADSRPLWLMCNALHLNPGGLPFIISPPTSWVAHAFGRQQHCHQACIFSRRLLDVLDGHSSDFGLAGDFDVILRASLVTAPKTIKGLLVEYEGGGLSAQNPEAVLDGMHRCRVARFGLESPLSKLDEAWVIWVATHRWLAGAKRRLRRSRRDPSA